MNTIENADKTPNIEKLKSGDTNLGINDSAGTRIAWSVKLLKCVAIGVIRYYAPGIWLGGLLIMQLKAVRL